MGRLHQVRIVARYTGVALLGLLALSLLIEAADFIREDGLQKASGFALRRLTKNYAQASMEMDRIYRWERRGLSAAEASGFWSGVSVTISGLLAFLGVHFLVRAISRNSN